jgi:hypothetical protein
MDLYLRLRAAGCVLPDYDGGSLVNLASAILDAFGALGPDDPPPIRGLDGAALRESAALVLILVDGLGESQLSRGIAAGRAPHLARLAGESATVTSVFPSSTVCALGSLDTARPPAAHGLVAYQHWLEEFGVVAQMLRWGPATEARSFADPPTSANPRGFVPVETIDARLARRGVARFLVQHAMFRSSPLVRMLSPEATYVPYLATSSAAVLTARLLRQRPWGEGRAFIFVYWPSLDTVSHFVGTAGGEHDAELHAIDELLVAPLVDGFGGDVTFLLTADHGHVELEPAEAVRFEDHPELLAMLRYPPAGEHRTALLASRDGQLDRVRRYCAEHFTEAIGVDAEEALSAGLYGTPVNSVTRGRIGDFVLIATGRRQFWYTFLAPDLGPHRASHGALSPEEMRVPLLIWRG